MIAYSEPIRILIINDRTGTMCGTDYVSDTTVSSTCITDTYVDSCFCTSIQIEPPDNYTWQQICELRKRGKRPAVCVDAPMPRYQLEERPIHRPVQILNRRMMFDKSGYLPKRIRRIRK